MMKTLLQALILFLSFTQIELNSSNSNRIEEVKQQIQITVLKGSEIIPYIPQLAHLRITIFHEYPYLYEGNLSYEEEYLRMYSQSQNSMLVIAQDHDQVIGAITGVPIADSMEEITDLFREKKMPTDGVYYLGEIVLLKEYRKKNLGYAMYKEFEKAVKSFKAYNKLALCEIDRSGTNLKKPDDYTSLDSFWTRQGFIKHPNLVAHFTYMEIGEEEETLHPMVFWSKELER